ncbi:hypothetical protein M2281_005224 [Mesorhizobium soli]|uniref:hypothetical protein n=1 Tax=Pseudaminobacter soli (ex Li et al. 2025) TaxID=1295366 RepID=UPI002475F5CA|nr:hypothetical protein [Mesorhizobium soli]MDH6234606.1 hypothetical protein [Mesorhizobium soli]
MTRKPEYHTGARKPQPVTGPDPNDDFSDKAAENRKPPLGMGLAEKVDAGQKRAAQEYRKRAQKPSRDTREAHAPIPGGKR